MVLNAESVTSMAAAEYHAPGAVDDDDTNVAMTTETAYAAPTVAATNVVFRSIVDFSDLMPKGRIPVPEDRPVE
jgi:hypothetical protein